MAVSENSGELAFTYGQQIVNVRLSPPERDKRQVRACQAMTVHRTVIDKLSLLAADALDDIVDNLLGVLVRLHRVLDQLDGIADR